MKRWTRPLAFLICAVMLLSCLSACSKEPDRSKIFDLVLWAPYVADQTVPDQYKDLLDQIPELQGVQTDVLAHSVGYNNKIDASDYAMNAMQLNAMATCGEVDVIIMTDETASLAARGGLFIPLEELFTQEELAAYEGRLMDFAELDVTGADLGTRTPVCGIALPESSFLTETLGAEHYGIYAVSDMGHPERVKAVMTFFLNLTD